MVAAGITSTITIHWYGRPQGSKLYEFCHLAMSSGTVVIYQVIVFKHSRYNNWSYNNTMSVRLLQLIAAVFGNLVREIPLSKLN